MFFLVHQVFNAGSYSWAEGYYLSKPEGTTLENILGIVWPRLLAPRMALSAQTVVIGPARASIVTLQEIPAGSGAGRVRSTGLARPAEYPADQFPAPAKTGALPNVAVRGLYFSQNQTRNKPFMMRGVWSGLDNSGGAITPGTLADQWKAKFGQWVNALAADGGGWFASNRNIRRGFIDDVVPIVNGAGRQTITMSAPFFDAALEVGKRVSIRISSATKNPTLNGTVVVQVTSTTTAETVKALLTDTYAGGAQATITPVSFLPIEAGQALRIGHHDTKNPTTGSRGRSKAKARG